MGLKANDKCLIRHRREDTDTEETMCRKDRDGNETATSSRKSKGRTCPGAFGENSPPALGL